MYLTEILPEKEQKAVDECLHKLTPNDWWQCRDDIKATISIACKALSPLSRGSLEARAEATRFVTGAIVAAIIEKLDSPRILEAEQAEFFAMSANLDHQVAACDWFIQHCEPGLVTNTGTHGAHFPLH